ncbi:MAG: hypothetical protein HQL54_11730 [Magnetococcales bacterium]|nr:hypothetical protein [Magnetococcales bacterium]
MWIDWRTLQLVGWLLFFATILFGGHSVTYLADLQITILIIGSLILGLVFLTSLFRPANSGCGCHPSGQPLTSWQGILASLGHFAPLFIFLIMGTTSLSLSSDQVDVSRGVTMRVSSQNGEEEWVKPELKPGEYWPVNLIDIYQQTLFDEPIAVEVIGRLLPLTQQEQKRNFPDKETDTPATLLYRFAIACCAADASPVGVVLNTLPPHTLSANSWVKIQGTTELYQPHPRTIQINVSTIEEIDEPKRPYLSWLTTIGP